MSSRYAIRETRDADLASLAEFFRTAYGGQTVFQDIDFLRWYFSRNDESSSLESLIAVDGDDRVVAHYGGLHCALSLNGRVVPTVWGANAFTLPECRGTGIGRELVERMMDREGVFGVIGFTPKTAEFYSKAGFNLFDAVRFDRHAVALDESAWKIATSIGHEGERVRSLLPIKVEWQTTESRARSVEASEYVELDWTCEVPAAATTRRDQRWLARRFFENQYIKYRCMAVSEGQRVLAAAFTRQEPLLPTDARAERIIDLFGAPECVADLLCAIAQRAKAEGSSYVDCATFGGVYDEAFAKAGFATLRGDDAALLPQVTSPIEARPNQEYVGLFSREFASEIAALKSVHFTRADSDRDRIARLSQLPVAHAS